MPETRWPIAFYAPLKPPDHPIPSGDRQMARMLLAALNRAGMDARLASRLIAYSKRPDSALMQARRLAAAQEARCLLEEWRQGWSPRLWVSYHPYDKSPDWLGEIICSNLGIPMVTIEPCRTGAEGDWLAWRDESRRILAAAACNVVMTDSDFRYVSDFIPADRITWLDPFVDADLLVDEPVATDPWPTPGGCRLLSVGMMRKGAKFESYACLAEALGGIIDLDWSLLIVGGGPMEAEIRHLFAPFGDHRVRFAGTATPGQVLRLMAMADLLTWPGCREAYGMVYLEAASRGLPSIAIDNMGVPRVVVHDTTGLLAAPHGAGAYGEAVARAIGDRSLRQRLGAGARAFVSEQRSGAYAAGRLREIIDGVLAP